MDTPFNPNATHAQFAVVRAQAVATVKAELVGAKLLKGEQSCFVARFSKIPDSALIEYANGSSAVKTAVFNRTVLPCEVAQTAAGMKAGLVGSKLSPSEQTCADAQINHTPDSAFIEFAKGTSAVKTAVVNRILRPCEAK